MMDFAVNQLDVVRASLLRKAFTVPSFKEIYLRRDKRLLVMFSLVLIFNLITSLFFPLYVLIIGPINMAFRIYSRA